MEIIQQSPARRLAIYLILVICMIQQVATASSPIIWTSSNYFQTATHTYTGTTPGPITEQVTVLYSTALTGPADRRVALGIVNLDYLIANNELYIVLVNTIIASAGFIVQIQTSQATNIKNLRFCYLAVDPSFPYPFSVSYFSGSSSSGMQGPFSNTYHVNFTQSTGVVMDMSHQNGMLAFQHIIQATSPDNCFQMQIQFFMANQSFYQVTLTTQCDIKVYYWGFSRFIFDKTAIQSLGFCFFQFGSIQSQDNDLSTLTVTFDNFMSNNFIFGLNSYSIQAQNAFIFDSILDSTTSVSTTMSYKKLRFMYWSFRYRTCPNTHEYFNYDTMLCYDACEVRYYQNQADKLCQPCYYTCYKCGSADPVQDCTQCSLALDNRLKDGSSCNPASGYYDDSITQALPCGQECIQCTDQNTCLNCDANLTIINGECQCVPVDIKNCGQCSDPDTCQYCNQGFYLKSGLCERCKDINCKICPNQNTCTQCLTGYKVQNNQCICDPNTQANCFSCSIPYVCQQCLKGYALVKSQCQVCKDQNSQTCSSPQVSTSCKAGKLLHQSWCYIQCPQNTYVSGDICIQCNSNCQNSISQAQISAFQLTGIVMAAFGGFLCILGSICCCKTYLKWNPQVIDEDFQDLKSEVSINRAN